MGQTQEDRELEKTTISRKFWFLHLMGPQGRILTFLN